MIENLKINYFFEVIMLMVIIAVEYKRFHWHWGNQFKKIKEIKNS